MWIKYAQSPIHVLLNRQSSLQQKTHFVIFVLHISVLFYNTDASLISAPQRLFQFGIEAAKQRKYYRRQERKRKDIYHHNGKKDNNFRSNANSKPKPQPDRTEH